MPEPSAHLKFRKASLEDARVIAELHAISWQSAYRGMLSDEYLDTRVFDERFTVWQQRLAEGNEKLLVIVADLGGQVLGFICLVADDDAWWGTLLDNLHVHPGSKGLGIGSALMQQAASWLKKYTEDQAVFLWVFKANEAACQFYERLGAKNVESALQAMPGGEKVASLRYAWSDFSVLIDD